MLFTSASVANETGYFLVAYVRAQWRPMPLGYARVSIGSQSLEAQLEALRAAGCERVYAEKRSGTVGERKELGPTAQGPPSGRHRRTPGSTAWPAVLVICSTRSPGSAGIGFKSLRETAIDTTTPYGRLTISILASIAQFERELILSRISEGRKRARQNGIKFGRKPKLTAYSQSTIARSFNVDRATISRLARR